MEVDEIRAGVDSGFICFMVLPLLFVVPLLLFVMNRPRPPVPTNPWDVLVMGKEETVVPPKPGSDSAYPPCSNGVKFGITIDDKHGGVDHLGLGASFVKLERPPGERQAPEVPEAPLRTRPKYLHVQQHWNRSKTTKSDECTSYSVY